MLHEGRTDLTPIKSAHGRDHQQGRTTPARSKRRWSAPTSSSGLSAGKVAEDARRDDGAGRDHLRDGQPGPGDPPGRRAATTPRVVATGRSDFPNQINNVLAFPGVFRGALDVRASAITEGMKLAAADALCDVVGDDVSEEYVIPSVLRPAGRAGGRRSGRGGCAARTASPALARLRAM